MPNSFSDQLWGGLGDGVADIREKFEEAMWGRAVTERGEAPQWPQSQEPEPSFGSVTHSIDVGPTHNQMQENANYRLAAMERQLNAPQWPQAEQGRDNDRRHEQDRDIDLDR
jgi:hypothetical protein